MPLKPTSQQASKPLSFPLATSEDLKRLRLFRKVPGASLRHLDGRVYRCSYPARETVLELPKREAVFSYFFFLLQGQLQISGFDEEARQKPLNFLRKGDFFVDKAFSWRGQVATKATAITAVELLVVSRQDLQRLAEIQPGFKDDLKKLADRVDYRNRTFSEDKHSRSALEFLIQTELTQGSRVKITQMDKCIECNICYTSCEERHGFQRIERGYARFGVLDFAKSCLTCFYPACIPSCPVDSVVFNRQTGEVEILDNCIGCSACATACQYGAILMHKVEPTLPVFSRFLDPHKKVKPKFIADKCNHCDGFDDLACVANCPTGAILEVEASELLEDPRILGAGKGVQKPMDSLLQRNWFDLALQKTYVFLAFVGTLFLAWEAFALTKSPDVSLLLLMKAWGWLPSDAVLEFSRGSKLCNFYGNLGFLLIMGSLAYPLRKQFPRLFKYLGREPAWLDFHNFCGFFGSVLILFHTAFVFPFQPSSFGIVALGLVVLSGLFGRFLYQIIPRGVAGTELRMRDIEEEDEALTQKLGALLGQSDAQKAFVKKIVQTATEDARLNPTFWSLIRSVIRTWVMLWTYRLRLPSEIKIQGRQVHVFLDLLKSQIRLQRNAALLNVTSRLFALWRTVHRPFAWIMMMIAVGHILKNLILFTNW